MRRYANRLMMAGLALSVTATAQAAVVLYTQNQASGWRGGTNATTNPWLYRWGQAIADGCLLAYNRTAIQNAINSTTAAHGAWDAKFRVTKIGWDETQPPATLAPMVASVQVDTSTLVWGGSTATSAGNGSWKYNGTTYPSFYAAVMAGAATGDSVVAAGAPWESIWMETNPDTSWDVVIDIPESLILAYLNNPDAVGLFVGAADSSSYTQIYGGAWQWSGTGDPRR